MKINRGAMESKTQGREEQKDVQGVSPDMRPGGGGQVEPVDGVLIERGTTGPALTGK